MLIRAVMVPHCGSVERSAPATIPAVLKELIHLDVHSIRRARNTLVAFTIDMTGRQRQVMILAVVAGALALVPELLRAGTCMLPRIALRALLLSGPRRVHPDTTVALTATAACALTMAGAPKDSLCAARTPTIPAGAHAENCMFATAERAPP
jgi:hypothetical protein